MAEQDLIIDFFLRMERQGPGGLAETEKALSIAGLDKTCSLRVADIGCGTGAGSLMLARLFDAQITAVDRVPVFLEALQRRAEQEKLAGRIETLACAMEELSFEDATFDLIWSEGAIYNIGFERGVSDWRRFLKPDGLLIVSEITWSTASRPKALQDYWETAYSEVDVASNKLRVLEQNGYAPLGYFLLPEYCWQENFYRPMQASFANFLARHGDSAEAVSLVEAEKEEIALYEEFKDYFSYGVYIAKKL